MTRGGSYVGRLQERANREVERELRGAIMKLADLVTDIAIERVLVPGDSPEYHKLVDEDVAISGMIESLRYRLAFGREGGHFYFDEDTERALRLAKEGRRGRAQRARRARAAEASASATVTPAPEPMRALPASTRTKRGKAPPAPRGEPIYVGGSQLFLLGPGEKP